MTKTDWQALDARILRDVMGRPDGQVRPSLQLIGKAPSGSEACDLYRVVQPVWQPHNDLAQAMLALRTLLTKIGHHATAKIAMRPLASLYHTTIQNWVSIGGVPAMLVRSPHVDNETHAICLAIEACLNTQGMPDWASG